MKKLYIIIFCMLNIFFVQLEAQTSKKDNVKFKKHEHYIELLNNAKDLSYATFLSEYDDLIQQYPNHIEIRIERCKLIEMAYYDEYEGYTLNYDELEACLTELYESYPDHPGVIIYKAEQSYGEEFEEIIASGIASFKRNAKVWTDLEIGMLYYLLAEDQYYEDELRQALININKIEIDLDLSPQFPDYTLLKARILNELDDNEKALKSLIEGLAYNHEDNLYNLIAKADLLMELDSSELAFKLYNKIALIDSSYIDNTKLAQIYLVRKNFDEARNYLVKDTILEWNKENAILKLYEFDIEHSTTEVALESYERLQELNFYNDFFGINRLKLFFNNPGLAWSYTSVLQMFILIITIVVLFVLPYLWVLPIQFLGKYFRRKYKNYTLKIPFNWSLKHFWLVSFLFLFVSFLVYFIFDYQGLIESIFEDSYVEIKEDTKKMANINILYISLMFLGTLLFLFKTRIRTIFYTNLSSVKTIIFAVLFVIINLIVIRTLKGFTEISVVQSLDIKETIKLIIIEYNFIFAFLLVAVIVPIYEELIFRGIIFSSVEKHLGFWIANSIQALIFAMIHENFSLFIFYFLFGFVLGIVVKRTKGLLTGIIIHSINNAVALIAIHLTLT